MALLVQLIVKVSLVLLAAWGLTSFMSRASAAARHLVWTAAVVTALVLPVAQTLGPSWDLPLLPAAQVERAIEVPAPSSIAVPSGVMASSDLAAMPSGSSVPDTQLPTTDYRPPTANYQPPTTNYQPPTVSPTPLQIALLVWAAIALLVLVRLAAGLAWAALIARGADDVTDEGWLQVLDDATASLGLLQPVALKVTGRTTIPVACGLVSPTVLLPLDAAEWPLERRRVVLLHELAHVARRDCLVQAMVHVARALYWFNPLVHVAAARVRAEQERACDDLVLAAGTDGPVYADHLFEIARRFRSQHFPAWATLAMARPSQLEGRVVAILDDRRNRRPPTAPVRLAMAAAAATLILSVGGLQLTAASSPVENVNGVAVVHQAADDALIDPNPIRPRPDTQAFLDATPARGGSTDVLVTAGAQLLDTITPDFAFDFSFDSDSHSGSTFDPHADQDFKLQGPADVKVTVQAQANQANQTTPVTDETRRRVADALITALGDENEDVREQALIGLASMRDPRAIPGLVRATRDASPDVREQAINALTQFDTPEAVAAITAALGDADPEVKERAVMAVSRYRNPEVVPTLLPMLKDANVDIREQVARTLGEIADPRAIDALTAALKDAEPEVREEAARALGNIARGQRRGNFPVPLPAPRPPTAPPGALPVPPRVPSAGVQLNGIEVLSAADMVRIEAAAEEAAEQAHIVAIEHLRDLRRSNDFPRLSAEERANIERELRNLEQELNRLRSR